ncbi:MAG TPA: bifunctional DNA-formamidopyrimidine glycosylase/DNA-(apurinic or apyrimidinic site) lyase [Verrucomicrobiae bacterium]|nr:bifunctional DNA-formamidopyrimidine glycosylase/DNA-(apurinic or apyrimidinic site) lyase [Verrucomicrobiae bacterium]
MPELPEVEVLVRHLKPLLRRKVIRGVQVNRDRVLRPTHARTFKRTLEGARFIHLTRRGKYLLFEISPRQGRQRRILLGHLGMTGRMYLVPSKAALPKHAAVVLDLGDSLFVFEDTRYFGRLTLDTTAVEGLGPEPLGSDFTIARLAADLARSNQPIKVKLLDQSLVAGIGNIYASEALLRAGISPKRPAKSLSPAGVKRLWHAIRQTLTDAVAFGSTVPLDYAGTGRGERLFYYGQMPDTETRFDERLQVYDREGKPCRHCSTPIKRIVQAARSTFFCPKCQS